MEFEIRMAIYSHRISFRIEQDPVKKAYYYLKPEIDNLPDKYKNYDLSRIVHKMLIEETGESFYHRIPLDKIEGEGEKVPDASVPFKDEDLTEVERKVYKRNEDAYQLYRLPQTGIHWNDILKTFEAEIMEKMEKEGLINKDYC